MMIKIAVLPFLVASASLAQTWQWALTSATDSLKRSFQPMRVEIPASGFEPALPKDPVALYAEIKKAGEAQARPAQILWTKADPSKVSVLWMEASLLPKTDHAWQLTMGTAQPAQAPQAFKTLKADSGIDVVHGDTKVYRYQDVYDPAKYGETRRPFNHVYGSDGRYITKGNEGEHPHQRGIFMGWNVNGHGYWTNGGGTVQIHKSYDSSLAVSGPVFSRVSSTISWQHNKVEEMVETRTVEAWWVKPGVALLDFRYVLTEPQGKAFSLDGEGAHAGMQFRAGDEVNVNREDSLLGAKHFSQEGFFRTGANYKGAGHWICQLFPIRGVKYLGMVMDHLDNPKPTEFPTRDYGRFGVFFNLAQPAGKPLPLYYRFLIADRSVQDTSGLMAAYNGFQYPPQVKASKGVVGLAPKGGRLSAGSLEEGLGLRLFGGALVPAAGGPIRLSVHALDGRVLRGQIVSAASPLPLASLPKGLVWIRAHLATGIMTRPFFVP